VGDQRRIMTPEQAQAAGVDYMVIGRPVTQSADPAETLKAINASLKRGIMTDSNSRLVYSTESGRIDEPKESGTPEEGTASFAFSARPAAARERACLISGIDLDDAELAKLAAELKKKCGCGGP
jgi:hypothetical protein